MKMVRPPRLERGTPGLEGRCSIQLSYGRRLSYGTPNRGDVRTGPDVQGGDEDYGLSSTTASRRAPARTLRGGCYFAVASGAAGAASGGASGEPGDPTNSRLP